MTIAFPQSRRAFVRNGIAALGATATLGCASSEPTGPGQTGGSPRLASRPGTPTGTPASGETALGLSAPRDGWLYVPTTYDVSTPTPLMVLSK